MEELRNLSILVTGATDGIGRVTAEMLSRAGARVLVHGRNREKVARTVQALERAEGVVADLSSLEETARLAREVPPIDVLVNNAGVGSGRDRDRRQVSRDGYELRFAVNYLAPFLLSYQLRARGLPRRGAVNLASAGQDTIDLDDLMLERAYDGITAYCRSKLALVMLTFDLAAAGLAANALHPGTYLDTNMVREAGITPMGPVSRGSESTLAVVRQTLQGTSGKYFDTERPARALPQAYDVGSRRRLEEVALALTKRYRQASR